ncbi:MAG: nitronate monooxygenase [Flavobacteriales bacterium TMED123]|nr:MAG: nitronate monooxygenase [Flavobacteriales bacterium TMED123]
MNRVKELFGIKYPIIQGGMLWCSGWRLASAVSNNGGLGLIGSASMYPEVLDEHIRKCKAATDMPFGVNIALLYPQIQEHINTILKHKLKIVFTSAGNPKKYTSIFKENGIKVVHVVPNLRFAQKAFEAGVDAIVVEGFEAGGHNGKDEMTTISLIPIVKKAIDIPIIAAGGIASGEAILAAFALGAEGVQIGSRFAVSNESSAHENFKNAIVQAAENDTMLTLKELAPVRLLKNPFYDKIFGAYEKGVTVEELKSLLGRGRAKKGIFEGDLIEGELEIGQVSAQIEDVKSVKAIMEDLITQYQDVKNNISNFDF